MKKLVRFSLQNYSSCYSRVGTKVFVFVFSQKFSRKVTLRFREIFVTKIWNFCESFPQIRPGSGSEPNPTDPDPGGQKTTDPALYILSLLIFYTTFRQIEVSRKVFSKNFRERLTKFRENCDTFRKSFRFREKPKKCFRPNPSSCHKTKVRQHSLIV
jgi:hypothetical protein